VALGASVATLVLVLTLGGAWPVALATGWGVGALVIVAWVWATVWSMDAAATKAHARSEDSSRLVADVSVLVASVASLVAIGYTVETAGNRHGTTKLLLILLAIGVVALSWLTVHTLYLLRYGDAYYGDPVGGIDFNDDEPPDYHDFAYLALTIGMTFQVSDTTLNAKRLRRLALRHALLSFVFVSVIVALTINAVASLLA